MEGGGEGTRRGGPAEPRTGARSRNGAGQPGTACTEHVTRLKAVGRPAGLQVVQKGQGVRGGKEGAGSRSLLPQATGAKERLPPPCNQGPGWAAGWPRLSGVQEGDGAAWTQRQGHFKT